jgi:hypothetical protein
LVNSSATLSPGLDLSGMYLLLGDLQSVPGGVASLRVPALSAHAQPTHAHAHAHIAAEEEHRSMGRTFDDTQFFSAALQLEAVSAAHALSTVELIERELAVLRTSPRWRSDNAAQDFFEDIQYLTEEVEVLARRVAHI